MKKVFDHMSYLPDMEQTEASLMDEVLSAVSAYDYAQYTAEDVRRVLAQRTIDPQGYAVLLPPSLSLNRWQHGQWQKHAHGLATPFACLPHSILQTIAKTSVFTVALTAKTAFTAAS